MFLEIDGQLVHTAVHGTGAPTVVGLPGVFGNMEIWQLPFEMLHRRFRTVAIDHYGTGETHVPPELVTFEHQVALVEEVLDALEVDSCVLAGDSSLAAVAVAAAHRWPDRVDGLVIVAGRIDHAADERARTLVIHGGLDALNPPEIARRFVAGIPDAELLLLEQCGHVPTLSHPGQVAVATDAFAQRCVRP